MESLFSTLTQALDGAPLLALGAALAWGVLSVVLAPCHLASIPLIVGFIDSRGRTGTGRAFLISTLFATGILTTIAILGALTAAAGRMLGDVGAWSNWFVAGVFLLVGLHLLGILPTPWKAPERIGLKGRGMLPAFLLGLLFGIALGPCTFAFMAPILGITFSMGNESFPFGVSLLAAYGIGHSAVIILAGTFTGAIQRYLDWNERSSGSVLLKKVCGLLVIAAGAWMIYTTL